MFARCFCCFLLLGNGYLEDFCEFIFLFLFSNQSACLVVERAPPLTGRR
jgi:hypothetical protein